MLKKKFPRVRVYPSGIRNIIEFLFLTIVVIDLMHATVINSRSAGNDQTLTKNGEGKNMINQAIIKKYLNGEASEKELALMKRYLAGKDLSLLKEYMAQDWSNDTNWETELPEALSIEMFQKIKDEIVQQKVKPIQRSHDNRRGLVAAAIILALGLSIFIPWKHPDSMVLCTTDYGEWKTLELPDGSWVKLNANATLKYANHWSASEDRRVWLTGEAFFKVEKKPETNAKFSVITNDLEVEVLGTSFNVNSRGMQTDVFLEEGSIKLSMGEQQDTMKAGEFVAYSAKQKLILERHNDTKSELLTSWKDGVLMLKDKRVSEILKKIEEIYGVKAIVSDSTLLKKIKTVAVPMDELKIALPVLEGTFEVKITQQKDVLLIK
ncbi:MAG: FecR domain-containing protein [Saprospiraceae bacterium]